MFLYWSFNSLFIESDPLDFVFLYVPYNRYSSSLVAWGSISFCRWQDCTFSTNIRYSKNQSRGIFLSSTTTTNMPPICNVPQGIFVVFVGQENSQVVIDFTSLQTFLLYFFKDPTDYLLPHGVNFINILRAHFSYKSALRRFSVIMLWLWWRDFGKKALSYKKMRE